MTDNRYIYIVKCNEYYKIGIADKPTDRFYQLQNGNPYKLELIATYEIARKHIKRLEDRFHRAFQKWNIRGEWFLLSDGQLSVVKGQCDAFTKIFK